MIFGMSKRTSLYVELAALLIIAAIASGVLFFGLTLAGEAIVSSYYSGSDYVQKKNEAYISRLQEHVSENRISSGDAERLKEWVKKQRVIAIEVYKDKKEVFNSEYPVETSVQESDAETDYLDRGNSYRVTFEDGEATVFIFGIYEYQFYSYAMKAELLIAFLVFLGIVMLGIRRTLKYIRQLSQEIKILEGGDLDYEITISGKDELTALAEGLDQMRKSIKEHMEQETHMAQANRRMITEMSHDLRTPLTSMMIYTEILKKRKYRDESQMWDYVDKIDKKAHQMKLLSDHIFEYSLLSGEVEVCLEEKEDFEFVFYDLLSETCGYLEQRGFRIALDFSWKNVEIWVNSDYVVRILDNVTSNIIKYADPAEPVVVSSIYTEEHAGLSFKNRKRIYQEKTDSTNIGINNIRNMLAQIGGCCRIGQDEKEFRIALQFLRSR